MDLYSLYLHIPFCRHRCSYCDFNTFAGQERLIPKYVDAICSEVRQVCQGAPSRLPIHTIFFGGGTPSLLSASQLKSILLTLRECFDFQPEVEVTLEANPGTVNYTYLSQIRAAGINRLSFGMQSAHPDDLRLLERQHDYYDVSNAMNWGRKAGFNNISLDLIFGLPNQTFDRWQSTLERAIDLNPDHLSLYALTIEHGTPLYKQWRHGLIPLVDDDLSADMYEYSMDRLEKTGFIQYEISNWAKFGHEGTLKVCLHNMQYWRGLDYFGFGAGAHGYVFNTRTVNVGGIRPYIERCLVDQSYSFPVGPATRKTIHVDPFTEMQEMMMVGLRLTQAGISAKDFYNRFGRTLIEAFGDEILRMEHAGLLEWADLNNEVLRLTSRGRLLGNQVFMQFVG